MLNAERPMYSGYHRTPEIQKMLQAFIGRMSGVPSWGGSRPLGPGSLER